MTFEEWWKQDTDGHPLVHGTLPERDVRRAWDAAINACQQRLETYREVEQDIEGSYILSCCVVDCIDILEDVR